MILGRIRELLSLLRNTLQTLQTYTVIEASRIENSHMCLQHEELNGVKAELEFSPPSYATSEGFCIHRQIMRDENFAVFQKFSQKSMAIISFSFLDYPSRCAYRYHYFQSLSNMPMHVQISVSQWFKTNKLKQII